MRIAGGMLLAASGIAAQSPPPTQLVASDLRVHFGLGTDTAVQSLDVRWAGGQARTYRIDRVVAVVTVDHASGAVTYAPR